MKHYLVCLCLLTCSVYGQQAHSIHSSIFPEPNAIEYKRGILSIPEIITIESTSLSAAESSLFAFIFPKSKLNFTSGDSTFLSFTENQTFTTEEYKLSISTRGIVIEHNGLQGIRYALQSLRQLINGPVIPCVTISDKPAFGYRGVHLDCSRHFFSLDEIKQFLNELAYLKYNTFHWHLTDDQGWRLEIKQYPKLTEIGAWRDSTLIGHYRDQPWKFDYTRYGGFYTQEQAKEVVAYAASLGIEVIPEIELPGHARAALAAYPELSCTGKFMPVESLWGVFDEVFCTKDETLSFLKNVLTEVAALFPSKYIHIGGDEVPKVNWEHCANCQAKMKQLGLKDEHQLQSFVIQTMEKHLNSLGKSIIGWDEILEGGLAPNATVMSWRGMEGGQAAAALGHPVIMTPTGFCYFDYYQSAHPNEPLAIGGYLPLSKVYAFNPTEGVSPDKQHFILGGQANFWSEYLVDFNRVQYHAFPRLAAMAEVLWNRSSVPYNEFVKAMVKNYIPHLQASNINFSNAYLDPKLIFSSNTNGIKLQTEQSLPEVQVFLDNKQTNTLILNQTATCDTVNLEVKSVLGSAQRSLNYTFTTHRALGIPVVFTTPPHTKYNTNGELGLTDGIIGQKPWKGNEWLGFEEDTVEFTLNLGQQINIKELRLFFLHDPASWIYQPKEVQFEFINKRGKIRRINLTNSWESLGVLHIKKVQSIRVRVLNAEKIPAGNPGAGFTPWTFISELVITQ